MMAARSRHSSTIKIGRRRRRSSTVESIALNVSTIKVPPNEEVRNKSTRPRSKSCDQFIPTESMSDTVLYPFTKEEKQKIWKKQTDKYESDLSIDFKDQLMIDSSRVSDAIDFKDYLSFTLEENNRFKGLVDRVMEKLDEILFINNEVTRQTNKFQMQSDELVSGITESTKLEKELAEKLSYFESLESVIQALNTSSSGSIVVKQSFRQLLSQLDGCMEFSKDPSFHSFKDSEVYLSRFVQCQIRALSLIRNYINSHIRDTEGRIKNEVKEQKSGSSSVIIDALVYEKFASELSRISSLFDELYVRCSVKQDISDEYFGLLEDCYNQYFKSRSQLLSLVSESYGNIIQKSKSTSQAAQNALTHFRHRIDRELDLFKRIFFIQTSNVTSGVDNTVNLAAINKFSQTLVEPLHEALRDKIIREPNISELCDVINTIDGYFNLDDIEDGSSITDKVSNQINYRELLTPLFEDTQSRLVFRIRKYIDKNVVNYHRTGKELTIQNRKEMSVPINGELDQSVNTPSDAADTIITTTSDFPIDTALIYPSVMKSIKLLSKVYQLVHQNVFDELANSIVHLSIESLKKGFENDVSVESKLYMIRNLIFLRDYVSTFNVEGATRETILDFTGLKSLYNRLTGRRQDTNGLLGSTTTSVNPLLAAIPRVITKYFNCRAEIQDNLTEAVTQFINASKEVFIQPLKNYPEKSLDETMKEFEDVLHTELPRVGPRIHDYIADHDTICYLIDGIQDLVVNEYDEFYDKSIQNENSSAVESLLDDKAIISEWSAIVTDMMDDMNLNSDSDIGVDASTSVVTN